MELVEWKEIAGFEKYSISNNGQIRNNDSGKILKQTINKSTGYFGITIKPNGRNGKCKLLRIHRELALAWIPNPDNKPAINHKDCNKTNNTIENLEWVSYQENVVHAFNNNLIPIKQGTDVPNAVLTDEAVRCIREEYAKGGITLRQLGLRYGVGSNTLSYVINRVTWKHVH